MIHHNCSAEASRFSSYGAFGCNTLVPYIIGKGSLPSNPVEPLLKFFQIFRYSKVTFTRATLECFETSFVSTPSTDSLPFALTELQQNWRSTQQQFSSRNTVYWEAFHWYRSAFFVSSYKLAVMLVKLGGSNTCTIPKDCTTHEGYENATNLLLHIHYPYRSWCRLRKRSVPNTTLFSNREEFFMLLFNPAVDNHWRNFATFLRCSPIVLLDYIDKVCHFVPVFLRNFYLPFC